MDDSNMFQIDLYAVESRRSLRTKRLLYTAATLHATQLAFSLIGLGADALCNTKESSSRQTDFAALLLYYGANATVVNDDGLTPFSTSLRYRPLTDLHELLFDYTFDEVPTYRSATDVIECLMSGSDLFPELLNRTTEILYDESNFWRFRENIHMCKPAHLRMFITKFRKFFVDYIYNCGLAGYEPVTNHSWYDFLKVCFEFDLGHNLNLAIPEPFIIAEKMVMNYHLCRNYEEFNQLLTYFFSWGASITDRDVHSIYNIYGYCDLLHLCLHLKRFPLQSITENRTTVGALILDMTVDVKYCIQEYLWTSEKHGFLLDYIMPTVELNQNGLVDNDSIYNKKILPKLEPFKKKVQVPKLTDLARNASRNQIIQRYNIKESGDYCRIVNVLCLPRIIKNILLFKTKLYFE